MYIYKKKKVGEKNGEIYLKEMLTYLKTRVITEAVKSKVSRVDPHVNTQRRADVTVQV